MASLALSRVAAAAQRRALGGSVTKRGFASMLTAVEEFPGVPATTPTQAKASTASVTTLPNGVTVVTEDASSTSTISLTFPNAGSGSEAVAEQGAALANKCMAFKSGSGLSSAVILRNIEDDGATPFSTAGRTGATVGYTGAPDKVTRLVPLLATDCSFEKWDVRDAIKLAGAEADDANSNSQIVLTEQLYAAAYGAQTSMGRQYYSPGASFATVKSFRDRTYVLNGAVLAATGVSDHEAFVRAVEHGFSEAKVGEAVEAVAPAYMGGETRVAASTGYAHVALAFQGPESQALSNVLKQCISLACGEGVSSFSAPGLIGVYGGADSAGASGIADALCAAVSAAPSADVVERAKGLAKAEALFALDGGSQSLADAMTKSVLETGTFSAEGLAASYDSITAQDVGAAFSAMAKSNPAMATVGDITSVPYHATVASRFG
uniref:Peptidase M16 N-terminal domain-containing protein n=1 Tax=Pseudictyota dubia TaxID=2749911 RepID=A0A6U2DZC4_9STRA